MSLQHSLLVAAMVSLLLPVAAVLLRARYRPGLVSAVVLCACAALLYLVAVLGLISLTPQFGISPWVYALVGSPVPILLTGHVLSQELGRDRRGESSLSSFPPLAALALLGLVALATLHDHSFIAGYDWAGGRGTLRLGSAGKAYLGYLMIGIVFTGHNLERTYRSSSGPDRRHLRVSFLCLFGVLGFFTFILTTGLLYSAIGIDLLVASSVTLACAGIVLAHGFLRGGLVRASTRLVRGQGGMPFTVVAACSVVLAITGAAELAALISWSPDGILLGALVLVVALVALLSTFSERFRHRVQCVIDRSLYANRHDYRIQWFRITESLKDAADRETLLDRIVSVLPRVFAADAATIALRNEAAAGFRPVRGKGARGSTLTLEPDSPLAVLLSRERRPLLLDRQPHELTYVPIHAENDDWLKATASQLVAPLMDGGSLAGTIGLSRRSDRESFTCEDVALLENVATHVGTMLRTLRLAEELASARENELMWLWSSTLRNVPGSSPTPHGRGLADLPNLGHNADPVSRSPADLGRTAARLEGFGRTLTGLRARPPRAMDVVLPNEIVRESLAGVQIGGRPSPKVTLHLEARLAVRGDRTLLRQVLDHLVTNAVEAMRGMGCLSISTKDLRADGQPRVSIEVGDTGEGMSDRFLKERLFRPFVTTKMTGLGLGLWQSRLIVRAHGGEIGAESQDGKGTLVRVVLDGIPLRDQAQARQTAEHMDVRPYVRPWAIAETGPVLPPSAGPGLHPDGSRIDSPALASHRTWEEE
jgi:signal transduction histidine kinase